MKHLLLKQISAWIILKLYISHMTLSKNLTLLASFFSYVKLGHELNDV